jgi:hypothetical protein
LFAAVPAAALLLPFAFAAVEEAAVGFAPGFLLVAVVFVGIVVCAAVAEFCDG